MTQHGETSETLLDYHHICIHLLTHCNVTWQCKIIQDFGMKANTLLKVIPFNKCFYRDCSSKKLDLLVS